MRNKNDNSKKTKFSRWEAPYEYSFCHALFKAHFTELNDMYWAFVPAFNTIRKNVKKNCTNNIKPLDYFCIEDQNDKRVAKSFSEWDEHYKLFARMNRLNMLLSATACFEIYLKSIVALSIESCPSILLLGYQLDYQLIDGASNMFNNQYTTDWNEEYLKHIIESVCKGDWTKRYNLYLKYFGDNEDIAKSLSELDEFRKLRNKYAHNLGRSYSNCKDDIFIKPISLKSISHKKLISFFDLLCRVVDSIDKQMYHKYIGSYELIKYVYKTGVYSSLKGTDIERARSLSDALGREGLKPLGTNYYFYLVKYIDSFLTK